MLPYQTKYLHNPKFLPRIVLGLNISDLEKMNRPITKLLTFIALFFIIYSYSSTNLNFTSLNTLSNSTLSETDTFASALRGITGCPGNITENTDAGLCSANVTFAVPMTDISGGSMVPISALANGDNFPVGTTTVTYEERDSNNIATSLTCSFTVTVIDNENPTITCAADVINASVDVGQCYATLTLTAPSTNDNCGIASVTNNAPANFPVGSTNVIWTVTDTAGRSASCTQNVTVVDDEYPIAICQNITVELDASGNAVIAPADINNGSSDNCGIDSMRLDITTFSCTDLGTNTVTLTVVDTNNNESTCTATVTVTDPAATATVSISASNNPICSGENTTFTATPTNGGSTPVYEWFINNSTFGNNSPTFTPALFTAINDGDEIYVIMQSSVSSCNSPKQSNSIIMTVNPLPVVNGPATTCVGNTESLSPATAGWVSNTAFATVSNTGVITANASGVATFTYTDANGCSSDLSITINNTPSVIAPTSICVNESNVVSPTTGGTWSSSDSGIATVTNSGVINGISSGTVTFTYTDTATGCSTASNSVTVLDIADITSVTASPGSICSGDNSILTATVAGEGFNSRVSLVNYNFNSGTSYGSLNGQEATGITSSVNSTNIAYDRSQTGIAATNPPAFETNAQGQALRQIDNWEDGFVTTANDPGGVSDEGDWVFDIGGSALSSYQDFEVYFDAARQDSNGDDKTITVEYSTNNGTTWSLAGVRNLDAGTTTFMSYSSILPGVTNPNNLDIRLRVNDGSTYSYWAGGNVYYNKTNPHVLIDNFQVRAALADSTFDYQWTVVSGDTASLPSNTTFPQITVTPNVTTVYEVSAINTDGCPATDTVTVNVLPSPEISFITDYCTTAPHNNEVMITAVSDIPGTTFLWNIVYPQFGDPDYHAGHDNTSATAYVDTAEDYQVIATAPNGCTSSTIFNISQELVVNGTFSQGNVGFNSDYAYHPDIAGNSELVDDSGNNGYSVSNSGQNVHYYFWGYDHTDDAVGNFMQVNGHGSSLIVWSQQITVEPNTEYYFSAWGMSMNTDNRTAQLTFNVNGVNIGTDPPLPPHPDNDNPGSDNWTRFYGNWTSPNAAGPITIDVEIRNLNNSLFGNDFGLDDISFATLDPFIQLTTTDIPDNEQTICQNTAFQDITYDLGGSINGADIQWWLDGVPVGANPQPNNTLPPGIQTSFNGAEFRIFGTPTQFGSYTYTISTSPTCGEPKTASGTINVEEAAGLTITLPTTTAICESVGTINLEAILSGSATTGEWSISGVTIPTTVTGTNATATYNITTTGPLTFTFTSNDPVGECDAVIETLEYDITPYFVANAGSNQTTASCANTTVNLAANNIVGQWTVTSGQPVNSYSFTDTAAYNSVFNGESGETYTLQWEAINTSPCINTTDVITVTFADCGTNIDFEGSDTYVNFGDNYKLNNSPFSIETWIKADNLSGTQTLISKRDSNNLVNGYDLTLINRRLFFRWNNQSMAATQLLANDSKWHHIAVTFNGTNTYTMYIDGFVIQTNNSGASPIDNTNRSILGAMDTTNGDPINYYDGSIDEVRFWNTELSQDQLHAMMNQEIMANGSNVSGVIISENISGLAWNNLMGYYQMRFGSQAILTNGRIQDISTMSPSEGKLNKMTTLQTETAPIPYISRVDAVWDASGTWLNGSDQQIPNSTISSVNGLAQTWNIVVTQHDITTNRPTEVLGLLVDNNKLSIINDQPLTVNNYLKIDGTLDLVGESQLIQPLGSIVDYSGNGNLERDQQGSSNLYNYNYWSSPVSTNGSTYTLAGSLHDGTNVANPQTLNWTNANDANPLTTPITLSRKWLYVYENYPDNSYADWRKVNENSTLQVGLGYTLKGSGSASTNQNYTFVGKPNNGTVTSPITGGYQALVGNPYPSAIDANVFINENFGTLADGTLYFWEHAPSNDSHALHEYEGGYAAYSLTGGVPAVSSPEISGEGNANKIPERYVPVAQGFYVTGSATGGAINFNNGQRIFARESGPNSIFLRNGKSSKSTDDVEPENRDQFIRIDFITPELATRHLLLGFMENPKATDGIDYGYDGINQDALSSDMSFNIEDEKFIIQGVGAFDVTKSFPLEINLDNGGAFEIALNDLENFDEAIDVFIFDALAGSYTKFNDSNFKLTLEAGNYKDRFYLVFQEDRTLSVIETKTQSIIVNFLQNSDEIYVKVPGGIEVKQLYLINITGQTVASWNATNLPLSNEIKIPVENVSEGSYILKVETNLTTVNKKIIIKY